MARTARLVRAACLTGYGGVARSCGLDPGRMLREARLPAQCLEQPDLKLPVESVRVLLERSAERSGCVSFGLLLAEGRRLSNLGILGMLAREEPTLREALQSLARHARVHNEAMVQRIEEEAGIAVIHEELLVGHTGSVRQASELLVAMAIRVIRGLLGPEWQPRRICFTHAAPAQLAVHRRVLGQAPRFGETFNGIVCKSAELDTPIATADPVMAGFIRRQLLADADARSLAADVRQMAMLMLPGGRCTIERVAQQLGMHRRTLHRQLAQEGETFSAILQAIRAELAARYVEEGGRPLAEVSQLLGFANQSSFSRWHRGAFGAPAETLRAAVRRPAAARQPAAPPRGSPR